MAATFLPAPRHKYEVHADESLSSSLLAASAPRQQVPPYGRRQSFVPRAPEDFGDGGSFPEIHVAQFPLEMGRPAGKKTGDGKAAGGGGGVGAISGLGNNSGSTAIVAVDVDENGKVGVVVCVFPSGVSWRCVQVMPGEAASAGEPIISLFWGGVVFAVRRHSQTLAAQQSQQRPHL